MLNKKLNAATLAAIKSALDADEKAHDHAAIKENRPSKRYCSLNPEEMEILLQDYENHFEMLNEYIELKKQAQKVMQHIAMDSRAMNKAKRLAYVQANPSKYPNKDTKPAAPSGTAEEQQQASDEDLIDQITKESDKVHNSGSTIDERNPKSKAVKPKTSAAKADKLAKLK